ncbi:MAG: 2Fe-2S iron-sulfur cluster binding domain-containing protein [Rickettsiaceae bacterium H1]|nr:2Fe-2S iron-sulfur cluster binding domain-containing protein [Rickettsiaceae bacterium H1]
MTNDNTVRVIFVSPEGLEKECEAIEGESILTVAHRNNVDLEGACEGSLACSTCHVIVDSAWYNELSEISDDENDMLDLAFGLEETSRLGCQVILTKNLDGIKVRLPSASRNIKTS